MRRRRRSASRTNPKPPAAPNPDVRLKPTRLKRLDRRAGLPVAAALLAAFVGGHRLPDHQGAGRHRRHRPLRRRPCRRPSASSDAQADLAPFAVPADGNANPFGTKAPALTGRPTRLKVKAIGLDTPLETLQARRGRRAHPAEELPQGRLVRRRHPPRRHRSRGDRRPRRLQARPGRLLQAPRADQGRPHRGGPGRADRPVHGDFDGLVPEDQIPHRSRCTARLRTASYA